MDRALKSQLGVFDRCVAERNVELAEQVVDEGFALVLVHPEPAQMSRERWLEVLPDYVVHSWDVEERNVAVDDDVAAVLQRVRMAATVLGEDRSGLFIISDTWRRRAVGWRIWRRHSTPLTAGSIPSVGAS
jgi:hypothetical protein